MLKISIFWHKNGYKSGQKRDFVAKFWIWNPDTCGDVAFIILKQNPGKKKKKKIRQICKSNSTLGHIAVGAVVGVC